MASKMMSERQRGPEFPALGLCMQWPDAGQVQLLQATGYLGLQAGSTSKVRVLRPAR